MKTFGPLSFVIVLLGWAQAALAFSVLPPAIPTQFALNGSVTETGSSSSLFFVPGLMTAMYLLLTAVQFVPDARLNVPVIVTDRNRARVYGLARGLLRAIRLGALVTILCIEWAMIHAIGQGQVDALFYVAVFVPVLLLVGWLGTYIVRMKRA